MTYCQCHFLLYNAWQHRNFHTINNFISDDHVTYCHCDIRFGFFLVNAILDVYLFNRHTSSFKLSLSVVQTM